MLRLDTSSRHVLVRVPSDKLLTIRRTMSRLLKDSQGETSPCTSRCTSCRTNNCSNEGCCASKTHATGIIPRGWRRLAAIHPVETVQDRLGALPGAHPDLEWTVPDNTFPKRECHPVIPTTDASDYGWGMTWTNGMSARGFWPNPHDMHIHRERANGSIVSALKTIEQADPARIKDKSTRR